MTKKEKMIKLIITISAFLLFFLATKNTVFAVDSNCQQDSDCPSGYTCEYTSCGEGCKGLVLTCQKASVSSSSTNSVAGKVCKSSDGSEVGKCLDGEASWETPACNTHSISTTDCSTAMFVVCCADAASSASSATSSTSSTSSTATTAANGVSCSKNDDCISGCCAFGSLFYYVCGDSSNCSAASSLSSTSSSSSSSNSSSSSSNSSTSSSNGVYIPTSAEIGLSDAHIKDILMNLLTWLLEIVGIVALIGFVISGIQYILSAGSEELMQTAKRNMLYSIMGVAVILASLVIVQAIDYALRGSSSF